MEGNGKSEDKDENFDHLNETEGGNRSVFTTLTVSTGSEWPKSTPSSFRDRFKGIFSTRNASPNNGNVVKEFTRRDPEISNSGSVSSTNTSEGLNYRHKFPWQNIHPMVGFPGGGKTLFPGGGSREIGGSILHSKKDKKQKISSCEELTNKGLNGVSTCMTVDSNKLISSNRPFDGNDCSLKVLSSSSFAKSLIKQTHQDKVDECRNPEPQPQLGLHHPNSTNVNFSEVSVYPMASQDEISSYSLSMLEPSSSDSDEVSLREWIISGTSEVKKGERLQVFRQVVLLVDAAHSEGIVLTDLRPSKFILASRNRVKYTGSFAAVESRGVRRPFELDIQSSSRLKSQKFGKVMELTSQPSQFASKNVMFNEAFQLRFQVEGDFAQMEKKWYVCSEELDGSALPSSNVYSLGVLLFELLCYFESPEMHSSAMLDLCRRVLPPKFLSGEPEEAGFCFWLLHPDPSSRPSTRDILQSKLIKSSEEKLVEDGVVPSQLEKEEDLESGILLDFLASVKEQKQKYISSLEEKIKSLEGDIKEVGKSYEPLLLSDIRIRDHVNIEFLLKKLSTGNMSEKNLNLIKNISQLENAFNSLKAQAEVSSLNRPDKAILSDRERWFEVQTTAAPNTAEKPVDHTSAFFQSVCKFAQYSKLEACGTLWIGDLLHPRNVICSLSFDRDENYIAAAGCSKKIKIFEFGSLIDASLDIQYSMVEMSSRSKLSCVCWNQYIQNYLASTDYDGVVQLWDASTGQPFAQYTEHQKRAWAVDFSHTDPAKFASGSDDCSVKLWSTMERHCMGTISNPANICCVQYSCYSSHLLAFGSADEKVYCYDLRHTKIPWCSLVGHEQAVSYVKFLDSETLVSASTDNTLKLWDLKKTSMEGPVSNACSLTLSGHTNERSFVGLSVLDGYIACGSETNEVFAYYRSLPMPIASYKFGYVDPISGKETDESNPQFISSVCWRRKSSTLVAANSSGSIKLLRMV